MTWAELRKRLDLNLVLIALLSVLAFAPLTYPGFFQSHSSFLPVFNLFDLERDLWGNWGWAPTLVRGFDLLRGEGALPYLLAEFLRWLGAGGVQAIKAVYLLGFVSSGLGIYLLGKEFYGAPGGLVAAVVYVYLPYHLATVYVRGAYAEAWAFVLYPLILLSLQKYMSKGAWLWATVTVLLYAAVALTNLGPALLYGLLLLAYVLILSPSRRAKGQAVLLLVLAVIVALLLQLPMVTRHGLVVQSAQDFTQHFVYPFQLLSASWGSGSSVPGWDDTLPLQLGLVATGLTVLSGMLLAGKDVDPTLRKRVGFFVASALVMAILVLPPASLLWRVSLLSYLLRYPWQLLAFVGLAMSVASGATVRLGRQLAHFPWQAVVATLAIVASYGYLSPRFTDVQVGGSPVAIMGDRMALLAYERQGPLLHGATVRLTLYWQSLQPMEKDYTVFVHIVDAAGQIWGQQDSMLVSGERPTSSWELGEIIEDEYQLTVDVEGPREGYTIELGVYDRSTGERLPVSSGATAVIID